VVFLAELEGDGAPRLSNNIDGLEEETTRTANNNTVVRTGGGGG